MGEFSISAGTLRVPGRRVRACWVADSKIRPTTTTPTATKNHWLAQNRSSKIPACRASCSPTTATPLGCRITGEAMSIGNSDFGRAIPTWRIVIDGTRKNQRLNSRRSSCCFSCQLHATLGHISMRQSMRCSPSRRMFMCWSVGAVRGKRSRFARAFARQCRGQ